MFGISGEHLLILGIILLVFGPKRLPEVGNTLGKAMKNFKDSISGIEEARFRRIDDVATEKARERAATEAVAADTTTFDATTADPQTDGTAS